MNRDHSVIFEIASKIAFRTLVDHVVMSMCTESSLVLLEEGVCYDKCIVLANTLVNFALLHFVLQGQTCLLLQVSLDFLLLCECFREF